jgi:hypothetical protein
MCEFRFMMLRLDQPYAAISVITTKSCHRVNLETTVSHVTALYNLRWVVGVAARPLSLRQGRRWGGHGTTRQRVDTEDASGTYDRWQLQATEYNKSAMEVGLRLFLDDLIDERRLEFGESKLTAQIINSIHHVLYLNWQFNMQRTYPCLPGCIDEAMHVNDWRVASKPRRRASCGLGKLPLLGRCHTHDALSLYVKRRRAAGKPRRWASGIPGELLETVSCFRQPAS